MYKNVCLFYPQRQWARLLKVEAKQQVSEQI